MPGTGPAACLLNAWLPGGWRVTTGATVTEDPAVVPGPGAAGPPYPVALEPLATGLARRDWDDPRLPAAVVAVTGAVLGLVGRRPARRAVLPHLADEEIRWADARTAQLVNHLARSLVSDADEVSVLRVADRPGGVARDDELHLLVRREDRIGRLIVAKASPRPVDEPSRVAALGALLGASLPLTNNADLEIGFATARHGLDLDTDPGTATGPCGRGGARTRRSWWSRAPRGCTEPTTADTPAAETPLLGYIAPAFDLRRVEADDTHGALLLVGPERISAITLTAGY